MESQENHTTMKKSKAGSETQAEAQTQLDESPLSPLRSNSRLRSDEPEPPGSLPEKSKSNSKSKPTGSSPEKSNSNSKAKPSGSSPEKSNSNSKAIVVVNKYSPHSAQRPPLPEHQKPVRPPPENTNSSAEKSPSPLVVFNRSVKEDVSGSVAKVGPGRGGGGDGFVDGEGRNVEEGGGAKRPERAVTSILRRSKRETMVKRAALGFRVCEVVFCLISFSVMAADKTQGWSGDSFDRYKEYRYCLSMTVIAFVYSGFQAYDLSYHLVTGKHVIQHALHYHFDFFMDQILAYLLISASSSSATQVDNWQSNWGKDEFTEMASASVAMAFLAFAAFAISSLISGYNLCIQNSS